MNYLIKGALPAFLLVLMGAGCFSQEVDNTSNVNDGYSDTQVTSTTPPMTYSAPTILPAEQIANSFVRIKTVKGDIVIKLYPETAPLTVSNFISLIEQDYYSGVIFHRREEGFVIQGGDPTGTGAGGPGYTFKDELTDDYTYTRGRVAMANRGPNTNGSQFFVMLGDVPLPKAYSIFGEVVEGMDVVDRIEIGDAMIEVKVERAAAEVGAEETP